MPKLATLVVFVGFATHNLSAQYVPAKLPLAQLPQEHAYQRTLRDFLATLQEKDFAIERREIGAKVDADPEEQYRLWLLTLNLPALHSAGYPAASFTLPAIESAPGLAMPANVIDSQMLAWLAGWKHANNPHAGSRALKLRAFVLAAIDLVMLDYLYEHNPLGSDRSDFLGGNLIWIGYTAKSVLDAVPPEVRKAFETGLRKHVDRLHRWGPRGVMTDMDLFAPVGLWYCSQALGDSDTRRLADTYARRMFTDGRFFHPAGYFVDVGCFDTSYNGISLYFATWAALASDWPFARDAVDKAFRLRAHLCLPDPNGASFGPSHMSSRTSADPPRDQWNFPQRPYAAALATDEALHLAPLPTPEVMKSAAARVAGHINGLLKPAASKPVAWQEHHWSGYINFAHEHYPKGYYTRRLKLENEASPLLKPLYRREGTFVREFERAFIIARTEKYAAVVHTGPIKGWPHGFGGGMVSAFWTPSSGALLLGRRRGMQGHVRDSLEEWRIWPVHALSGTTADGTFFTSASISQPEVKSRIEAERAEIDVAGGIRIENAKHTFRYERRFRLDPEGLKVQTSLKCEEPTKFAELYEALPLFLHELGEVKNAKSSVRLQVGDTWVDASAQGMAEVKAVRVERLEGGVDIVLDRPRTVRLSPRNWTDGFQTQATCRSLLIDVGGDGGITSAEVGYTMTPRAK